MKITAKSGININHRKENNFYGAYSIIVNDNGELNEILSCRVYGTNAMNYSCVWLHDRKNNIYASGSGKAGGYGYHRESAAVAEALNKAGIELDNDISGRGDSAIESALTAIAKHLGYTQYLIHKAHA